MTSRYRCPWCRSFRGDAKHTRFHILDHHRKLLIDGLALLESFGTRKTLDPPRNASNGHPPRDLRHTHTSGMPCRCDILNPGVSGEGDS